MTQQQGSNGRRYFISVTTILVFLLGGCAQQATVNDSVVLYPELPQVPKIQFLTTIKSEEDLMRATQSAFRAFVVGDEGAKYFRLGRPMAVAHRKGELFFVDRAYKAVLKADLATGRITSIWDSAGGPFVDLMSLDFGPDNRLYIVDAGRKMIIIYNDRLEFEETIFLGDTTSPRDAAIVGNNLYVTNFDLNSVLVFDIRTGEQIKQIGGVGTEPGTFRRPTALTTDGKENIFVVDTLNNRVQRLPVDDGEVQTYGYNGTFQGAMVRPKGMDIDRDGNFYVADSAFEFVSIFDSVSGAPRMVFAKSSKTAEGNLFLPNNVHIDYDNIEYFQQYAHPDFDIEYLIYVSMSLQAINVYAFGKWTGPLKAQANRLPVSPGSQPQTTQKIIGDLDEVLGNEEPQPDD